MLNFNVGINQGRIKSWLEFCFNKALFQHKGMFYSPSILPIANTVIVLAAGTVHAAK